MPYKSSQNAIERQESSIHGGSQYSDLHKLRHHKVSMKLQLFLAEAHTSFFRTVCRMEEQQFAAHTNNRNSALRDR